VATSPSTGRYTPNTSVPPIRARTSTVTKKTVTPSKIQPSDSTITPGSRASKYVGMTAKQLSGHVDASSPSRKSVGSPTPFSITSPTQPHPNPNSPSRTRKISSPFTPKAGRTQSGGAGLPAGTPTRTRIGPGTPRARLPSSVSMPPPPSPSNPSNNRSISLNDPIAKFDADQVTIGRTNQEMIGGIILGRPPSSRPPSSASVSSSLFAEQQLQLQYERLQAKFDVLEDENKRLRGNLTVAEASSAALSSRLVAAIEAGEKSATRIVELESSLRAAERTVIERNSVIEAFERSSREAAADTEKAKNDNEARVRDMQSKLEDKEQLITQLKELVHAKEGEQSENDEFLATKNAEIALLENRVQKAYVELEEERRELGSQVDELRKAGQVTSRCNLSVIVLY
jgi:CAP-Gly domain-containing linker protein 1